MCSQRSPLAGQFRWLQLQGEAPVAPPQRYLQRLANPALIHRQLHLGGVLYGLAAHLLDQVAGLKATLCGWAAWHHLDHHHPIHLG